MGDTTPDHHPNRELRKLWEFTLSHDNSQNFAAGFGSMVQIDGRLIGEKLWERKPDI
jgi:hypothetical protein